MEKYRVCGWECCCASECLSVAGGQGGGERPRGRVLEKYCVCDWECCCVSECLSVAAGGQGGGHGGGIAVGIR